MNASTLSTQELLRLCLESNDQGAWLEFVRRFQPLIARVVFKVARHWKMPGPEEVDDLVQETFVKLCLNNFRALREFDCQHEKALFGFLKVIASNVVQDHFRSSYSQKRGSGRLEEDLDQAQIASLSIRSSENVERKVLLGEIGRWLESQTSDPNLSRDCVIFWLYYQQGLTAKAISDLPGIGLTVKGVESALLRMIRLIRERINRKTARSEAAGSAG